MSTSASGYIYLYGGVPWTLTATADSSPETQTLTVSLDGTLLCVFEGSGGGSMTLKGTESTEEHIKSATKFRKLSWTLETDNTNQSLQMRIAEKETPLTSGPLKATPGLPEFPDNPYFFELPANTAVQLTAICSTNMEQHIEYGALTTKPDMFSGRVRDTPMKLSNDATSAKVGPFRNATKIVALFTYRPWPQAVVSVSQVGDAVTAGKDIILTTVPARHAMYVNAVPPWLPLPFPVSTLTTHRPDEHPVGHVTAGEQLQGENIPGDPPVIRAPAGSSVIQGNPQDLNHWWILPRHFSGVGALLNIARDASKSN